MFLQILLVIFGFFLLIKGADVLVEGSANVAKKFKIPEIIIGLTIVSIGTSFPELFVSVTSAFGGLSDISLGNVIGSNICNLLLILGLSATIAPIEFKRETKLIEIPISLFVTIVFFILCNTGNVISKKEGLLLIALFVMFIIYTIVMAKKGNKFDSEDGAIVTINTEDETKKINILKSIIYIILGIVALKYGADFVVNNCEKIAKTFNISDKIIGLTIIAIGTSLPELVTSVVAAKKGDSDISIGNVIGSNIFNILLIIGVASSISPINYSLSYNLQMSILLFATLILELYPFIRNKNKMGRLKGSVYILLYIMYMILLFIK